MNLHAVNLRIEKLPEGVYLATSEEVQGLVAQGRTIQETSDIAQDVASKLMGRDTSALGGHRRMFNLVK